MGYLFGALFLCHLLNQQQKSAKLTVQPLII